MGGNAQLASLPLWESAVLVLRGANVRAGVQSMILGARFAACGFSFIGTNSPTLAYGGKSISAGNAPSIHCPALGTQEC